MHDSSPSALKLVPWTNTPAVEQRNISSHGKHARSRGLVLAFLCCFAAIYICPGGEPPPPPAAMAEPGFVSLFDGRTLEGWTIKCLPKDKELAAKAWTVDRGTILANTMDHAEHFYIMLVTQKEYGDFVLRIRLQVDRGITGNSGIQIRSRYNDQTGWMEGPQIDINPPGPELTGKLWNEGPGPHRWLSNETIRGQKFYYADQGDGWNDLEITANGTKIKSVLNGVTVVDYDGAGVLDDELHRKLNVGLRGMIGLQIHSGHELKLRFKDIRLKAL